MKKDKFLRYEKSDDEYWRIEKADDTERGLLVGNKVAIFYDHKVGAVSHHGTVDEVKEKVRELMDGQKKAEGEIGFFLTDYRYYAFDDIEVDVLNRIINETGFFPEDLKQW